MSTRYLLTTLTCLLLAPRLSEAQVVDKIAACGGDSDAIDPTVSNRND